jgi:fatty acid desaturase
MLGLRNNSDLKTLFFLFLYFGSAIFLWNFSYKNAWLWFLSFLVVCWFSFIGAVATHNAMHLPVFYSERSNRIFSLFLTLSYGHPVSTYVSGHNISHHGFTQLRRDLMRTSKVQYSWHFLNGFFIILT